MLEKNLTHVTRLFHEADEAASRLSVAEQVRTVRVRVRVGLGVKG